MLTFVLLFFRVMKSLMKIIKRRRAAIEPWKQPMHSEEFGRIYLMSKFLWSGDPDEFVQRKM